MKNIRFKIILNFKVFNLIDKKSEDVKPILQKKIISKTFEDFTEFRKDLSKKLTMN